jgi:hypothetical protein
MDFVQKLQEKYNEIKPKVPYKEFLNERTNQFCTTTIGTYNELKKQYEELEEQVKEDYKNQSDVIKERAKIENELKDYLWKKFNFDKMENGDVIFDKTYEFIKSNNYFTQFDAEIYYEDFELLVPYINQIISIVKKGKE